MHWREKRKSSNVEEGLSAANGNMDSCNTFKNNYPGSLIKFTGESLRCRQSRTIIFSINEALLAHSLIYMPGGVP